ncbi:MAG TPA: ATP-dependent DNA ligase [Candidatus Bathyarchaeia archaeon]|nr:ATP-dependent DNA ligase [Candidatus Bathyarchaeia archaeon]
MKTKMLYSQIVAAYERISQTTSRIEIIAALVQLLKETDASIIDKVVYLTQGKLYPDYFGIEIGVAEKLAIRSISLVSGKPESRVMPEYKTRGDLGSTAEEILAKKNQAGLGAEPLTVEDVYNNFDRIARSTGSGSVETKIRLLSGLLTKATATEAKYITRMAVGRLRLGVADMTILHALAQALGGGKSARTILEQAYNRCSDLGLVAKSLAAGGIREIGSFKITIGRPVRPMLSERLSDPVQILEKMGGKAAAEYKYDGLRIQAHLSKKKVALFSRRLENVTDQFPDVQELVRQGVEKNEAVIEGEVVAIDTITGELLPFQLLSQRRGRKHRLEESVQEIPIALFPFDILYSDGTDYTLKPYPERRKALANLIQSGPRFKLSVQTIVEDPKRLDEFMQEAVSDGSEGVMVKSISNDSTYKAGARGWTWIKYKREYKSEMQDTADLVIVGAFAGRGRRGGLHGAVLLAAYNDREDLFETVCKCGSGFTDEDLGKLPKLLEKYATPKRHARVSSKLAADAWFVPGLVIEVIGAEITLSPVHTCGLNSIRPGYGLAIRFPRFTGRYRTEKSPEDATTTREIVEMYQAQLKKIGQGTSSEGET